MREKQERGGSYTFNGLFSHLLKKQDFFYILVDYVDKKLLTFKEMYVI